MTPMVDDEGRTPESFVREFLMAFRSYELEAFQLMTEGDAEQARRAKAGDPDWYPEDADRAIDELFDSVLERFTTHKVVARGLGAHFESPPMTNVTTTEFIGSEPIRGGVLVRTREGEEPYLGPTDCEYRLTLVDGKWRLDDRREKDYQGKWHSLVF